MLMEQERHEIEIEVEGSNAYIKNRSSTNQIIFSHLKFICYSVKICCVFFDIVSFGDFGG